MIKNDYIYIEHITKSLNKVLAYIKDMSFEEFEENTMAQDACIRQFEIIGEATKRISEELKEKNPDIPWKDMAGMRDKLIHEYIDIDIAIVYKTAKEDAIDLLMKLEKL